MSNETNAGVTAPEPQAMTLEEGLAAIFPDTIARRDDGKWPFFTYVNDEYGHTCTAIFGSWTEAVSAALGRPVVARDDAAELRAALRRCSNLIQDFLDFGIAPVDRGPARHAVEAARAALAKARVEP